MPSECLIADLQYTAVVEIGLLVRVLVSYITSMSRHTSRQSMSKFGVKLVALLKRQPILRSQFSCSPLETALSC